MSETPQKPQPTSRLKFVWDYLGWRDPDPAIDDDVKDTGERFDEKSGECGDKENEKATSTEEPTIEDLVAMVWQLLDQLDRDNSPVSTPTPLAVTPPSNSDPTPESDTLLERNQAMLSSTPPLLRTVPDVAQPTPSAVPPLADSKLPGYISSPEVVNGAQAAPSSTEKQTKSVWEVLVQLVPYKLPVVPAPGSKTDGEEDPEEEASETSWIPLIPDPNSKVELAKSIVQCFISNVMAKGGLRLSGKAGLHDHGEKQEPSDDPTPPPTKPAKEVKASIPSKMAISFQATWWGYRLWLPPPVMDVLSKQAPTIAGAFGWLTEKMATANLPPPLETDRKSVV